MRQPDHDLADEQRKEEIQKRKELLKLINTQIKDQVRYVAKYRGSELYDWTGTTEWDDPVWDAISDK